MKYILRLFISIIFINVKTQSFSQVDAEWKSTLGLAIDKYCDSLMLSGIDTSITLFYTNNDMFYFDTLKGVNNIGVYESAFLMYFKDTNWHAVKLFYGIPPDKMNGAVFNSQSIALSETDSLKKIKSLIPKIKKEEFEPYIFAYEQNNETVYRIFGYTQHNQCNLIVRWKDHYDSKEIRQYDVLEKIDYLNDKIPINLNFKYNKSLSLYPLYQLFLSMSIQLDNQFYFKKSTF